MLGFRLSIPSCALRVGDVIVREALAVLAKYGTDAHVYLPGIGVINGLTAGNYLDSAGTTAATVDNPVGLVLDAAGSVGAELVTNGDFSSGTGWTLVNTVISGGKATITAIIAGGVAVRQSIAITSGKTYEVTYTIDTFTSGDGVSVWLGGTNGSIKNAAGTFREIIVCGATNTEIRVIGRGAVSSTAVIDNISVKEVLGIHALQSTTANKGILRQTSGKYNWVFDATDLLTATYPAGHESVTIIDSKSTGQETTSAVNIVGSYSMGPSVTLYGRFIFKTITASELAVIQTFANRLAGL